MEMGKCSDYSKYLILADNSHANNNGKHKIRDTYDSFLNFKTVMTILSSMAYTDKSTYSYDNTIYNKKITSEDAKKIIHNVGECKWTPTTAKMKVIAAQLCITI